MANEVDSILHKEPPRWVQGKAECRVDLKFAALRQIVERDVGDFNGLNDGQRGGRRFNFNSNGEGTYPFFTVEEQGGDMRVEFKLTPHSIRVNGGGDKFSPYIRNGPRRTGHASCTREITKGRSTFGRSAKWRSTPSSSRSNAE